MRPFCWHCHRPVPRCFCNLLTPFASIEKFALVIHPYELKSTVGTAWILRRSISNLNWFRSKGVGLDSDSSFLDLLAEPDLVPLLVFPGPKALNLSQTTAHVWRELVPYAKRPLFFVIDGTWTQAHATLRKSSLLRALPRVSFDTIKPSEYGFKSQPHPSCLSSVETVHHLIELLAAKGFSSLPAHNEHERMIEIFRRMARDQAKFNGNPRELGRV